MNYKYIIEPLSHPSNSLEQLLNELIEQARPFNPNVTAIKEEITNRFEQWQQRTDTAENALNKLEEERGTGTVNAILKTDRSQDSEPVADQPGKLKI